MMRRINRLVLPVIHAGAKFQTNRVFISNVRFLSINIDKVNDLDIDDDDNDNGERVSVFDRTVPKKPNGYGNSVSNVPIRPLDEFGRAYATGRRKSSVARVWVKEGSGQFIVNNKSLHEYFQQTQREQVLLPFIATETSGLYDVWCTTKGGGISGQAGSVRLGVSRALLSFDTDYRPALKAEKLLTRDARKVERKKPGQPKARKKFQWVKR